MKSFDKKFEEEKKININNAVENYTSFMDVSRTWMHESAKYNYTYNFSWLGVPIIQFPQDIVSLQEIVFDSKPDLIIETGVARGGSVIYSASLLALIDLRESLENNCVYTRKRRVIGIDIDIRDHAIDAIKNESLRDYIELIVGSSVDKITQNRVQDIARNFKNPMVLLDSNHTESHVLAELEFYSTLINNGGYIVVYDTSIEFDSCEFWLEKNRDWGPGNSPLSALRKFLQSNTEFEIIESQSAKLGITVCPHGILRKKSTSQK